MLFQSDEYFQTTYKLQFIIMLLIETRKQK